MFWGEGLCFRLWEEAEGKTESKSVKAQTFQGLSLKFSPGCRAAVFKSVNGVWEKIEKKWSVLTWHMWPSLGELNTTKLTMELQPLPIITAEE